MAKKMPDWFGGKDIEDLKKILDDIIKKINSRHDKMEEIKNDAAKLNEKISDATKHNAEFDRVDFVVVMSIMDRFLYVSRQDVELFSRELENLVEMKKKLSRYDELK